MAKKNQGHVRRGPCFFNVKKSASDGLLQTDAESNYIGVTFSACGPLSPAVTFIVTACPS